MTSEYLTVWQSFAAGAGLVLGSLFYSFGGRKNKFLRRYVGATVLAGTVCGIAVWRGIFNPWMMATLPILVAGFSMGYGSERPSVKFVKRLLCCLAVVMAGVVMAACVGGRAWAVLPFHFGVALFSIYLGCINPIAAASEEFFVCLILNTGLMAYCFVGGV